MKTTKDYSKDLDGIDFLRRLVNAYGYRDEHLNGNKSPIQLVNEFLNYTNGITDLDGNKIED